MDSEAAAKIIEQAAEVLKNNDRGGWTMPAADFYPHQWLWDSCFISIGLRHIDLLRAQQEIRSLLRGQWDNGMLPNMIFDPAKKYRRDRNLWRSWINPYAPEDTATSGITQPPMLAEAILKIGQKMNAVERRGWFKEMLPYAVKYHDWLYSDRDPHNEGLVLLLHPYEGGLDDSPPWISELRKHSMPLWLRLIEKARMSWVIGLFRRDTQHTKEDQRSGHIEAAASWASMQRLRRKAYNTEAILSRSVFAVEDIAFNSIFIRANSCLKQIAKVAGVPLPAALIEKMDCSAAAIEDLWDEEKGLYFSRSFVSHKLIGEPSVASLLPLYSGEISKNRATELIRALKNDGSFNLRWPVPSVPKNSNYFSPYKYWQGPAWININWMIIEGLSRYGFGLEAKELQNKTIQLVAKSGFYEYFNPLNAKPAGAANFSWTAALTIDLLKN